MWCLANPHLPETALMEERCLFPKDRNAFLASFDVSLTNLLYLYL